ncbi:hypothetical protein [Actinophytocola sp.]|uniref:hypothetical protein n=1 Tax=Actinophytocola sp. TaxID=1872138 RepID=UPI002D254CBE|nr:hypothetical protein [Actinophytocola sp.]HYQ63640.1 hypothetical protein [Actinophytocola sp.]
MQVWRAGLVVVGTTVLMRVFDGRPSAGMALATSGSSAGLSAGDWISVCTKPRFGMSERGTRGV